MWDSFIINAIIAGVGVTISAGVLGCFIIWRRMAYFTDALAHSAILGVSLGLLVGVEFNFSIIIVSFVFASLLLILAEKKAFTTDGLIGVLAYSFLALGIIIFSLLEINVDLHSYLFGDILAISLSDIYFIYLSLAVILVVIITNWQKLLLLTISEDIAKVEGVNTLRLKLIFMFLSAVLVATSVQIVGALLIGALIIIPALTARTFSNSINTMVLSATFVGILAIILGVYFSIIFDSPTGPSIVIICTLLFMISLILTLGKK
jgi:zinc transport system permease protein